MRVVATAGHVDHGKSTLVLALTGTDPDRFPEEKARGLTIDLGFAFTTLASGTEIGFVDVPGHVRFIKNMLAGVGAVDVAVLVVDAGEGWMPQSEEHLRILELLGVTHGIVALTKADTVDAETLELAELEVSDRLHGSPLAHAPIVVCDGVSGRGLDDVRATLDRVLAEAPAARDVGRPRLWVDRVFTARGAGTVVTGTLTGGAISIDDEVGAAGRRARVRGIETAGRKVKTAMPGSRVALNLAGVEHRDIVRGDAVVRPGQWREARTVDVRLMGVPGEDLRRRGRFQAYVGSGERRVWLRVLDDDDTFARLRFDRPVPLAPGDRIVLRDTGRKRTVAGAEVLDVTPTGRAKDAPTRLALPIASRLLATQPWLAIADIGRLAGCSESAAAAMVDDVVARGEGERRDGWLIASATLEHVRTEATTRAVSHHAARQLDPGVEVSVLAGALDITTDQLRAALATVPDVVVEQGFVRHVSHTASATSTVEARRFIEALDAAPFAPPAATDVGVDRSLVRALIRDGAVVDLDGVVFSAGALVHARGLVVDAMRERGPLTVADIRDVLGSTRKYVLPIVGWLDREGVTRRRGDQRVPGPASGLGELPLTGPRAGGAPSR